MIAPGVLIIAHADQGLFQEPDHSGEHLSPRKAAQGQISIGLGESAARLAERHHPVVLGVVADFPPTRVIAVLLPPLRITARGLDMPPRRRADPDLGPGGRDRQTLDPCQDLGIADRLPVGSGVAKALPGC